MNRAARLGLAALAAALGLALCWAMLGLPPPALSLAVQVHSRLDASGVDSAVTAVLLNFRSYDTLLEIAVLLLALFGVLSVNNTEAPFERRTPISPQPALAALAARLAPLVILVAAYLLWAGVRQAGGAFQAAAVLAAGAIMLFLAGRLAPWPDPPALLRLGLLAGLLLFLAVASLSLWRGQLLRYPAATAGLSITAIEIGLTISVGLTLAGFFAWLPDENEEEEEA